MRVSISVVAAMTAWLLLATGALSAQTVPANPSNAPPAAADRPPTVRGTRPHIGGPTPGDTLSDAAKRWNRRLALESGPTMISQYARSSPAQRDAVRLESLLTPAALHASPVFTSCRSGGAQGLRPKQVGAWLPDSSGWWEIEAIGLPRSADTVWQAITVERGWRDGRWLRAEWFTGILNLRAYRPDGAAWELFAGSPGTHAAPAPVDSLPRTILFPASDSLATLLQGLARRVAALDCATLPAR